MPLSSEKARELALKSHQPDSARFVRPITAHNQDEKAESFRLERLSRVRAQLTRLDKMLNEEFDPQKLDRLASAIARLSEQERLLTGRPMPGSLKPLQGRQSSRKVTSAAEVFANDPVTPGPLPAPPSPAPANDPNAPNG